MSSWDERYEAVVRFLDRCGALPAPGNLRDWIEEQKEAIQHLSPERVVKLYELGIDLNLPREKLQELGIHVEEDAIDAVTEEGIQRLSKRQKLAQNFFWRSAEAAKLFGFTLGDDVLKRLQDRIDLVKKANETVDGWKHLVPNDGKEDLYSDRDIMLVRHKAQYLIKAYLLAIETMNTQTWKQCCRNSASSLHALGLTKITGDSIMRWNLQFRVDNVFTHPGKMVNEKQRSNDSIRIFEYFPKSKDRFLDIANINIDKLTGKLMKKEFSATILPELERESRENECFDNGSPEQKLLVKLLADPPSEKLILRWLRQFDVQWDTHCTRKGRDGNSYLSQRMREAWAAGKYSNRRPKGQGKRGYLSDEER
jgi:hypothetical protein